MVLTQRVPREVLTIKEINRLVFNSFAEIPVKHQDMKKETGAPVHVSSLEPVPGADGFSTGKSFQVDALKIETRQTSGHSKGGITYVISGLERPVAVVGDALFAGSMGGGAISWDDALANNRKHIFSLPDDTVICPGHGPLTTVREEKRNNPFYPEFKN